MSVSEISEENLNLSPLLTLKTALLSDHQL
jgi:hypothetical protein